MNKDVVVKPRTVRGLYITDLGQKVEEWLPEGMYEVEDDAGNPTVVGLVNYRGWMWTVPRKVAEQLRSTI